MNMLACRLVETLLAATLFAATLFAATLFSATLLAQSPLPPKPSTKAPAPAFKPLPVPRALLRNLGDRRIRIDGSVNDWPKVGVLELRDPRLVSGTSMASYHGALDISAIMFMAWNERRLYLALKVRDDWHRPMTKKTPQTQEIPPVDSVLITFDPNRNTRSLGQDRGREEDREFWLADVEQLGRSVLSWDRLRGSKNLTVASSMAIDRNTKSGETTYEASIPWARILPPGRTPGEGMVLNMQVVIDDYDEPTDPMPQSRIGWTFGMGPVIDPGIMGSVMLVGEEEAVGKTMPEFPKAPAPKGEPVPEQSYWVGLDKRLAQHPPAWVTKDSVDPAMAGGKQRYDLLRELEGHMASYPRMDFMQFQARINRRMLRETAGIIQRDLPFYWDHLLNRVARQVAKPIKDKAIRVYRLPQSGWLVCSDTVNFAINPAGSGVERLFMQGSVDFVLTSNTTDPSRRNDPMLMRVLSSKKPVLTHWPFHLPGIEASKVPYVEGGKDYPTAGLAGLRRIRVLGKPVSKGLVTPSIGYLVEWEDGRQLLFSGLSLDIGDLQPNMKPDVLILSGENPNARARALAHFIQPKAILVDDALLVESLPAPRQRWTLAQAIQLQKGLLPWRSMLLAPGEFVDL